MIPPAADEALFGDALGCEQLRPAAFEPRVLAEATAHALCVRAESFLQSIALVEDSRVDEPDEHSASGLALHRIEARLDLLTQLVARLARQDGDVWQPVRWSALGARLPLVNAPAAGTNGVFRIQPCDWLPESMELPATVLAVDAGMTWLRFEPLSPGAVLALERHLFRVHRREIAGRRGRGRDAG